MQPRVVISLTLASIETRPVVLDGDLDDTLLLLDDQGAHH
jgi:hypothetical protein